MLGGFFPLKLTEKHERVHLAGFHTLNDFLIPLPLFLSEDGCRWPCTKRFWHPWCENAEKSRLEGGWRRPCSL